MERSISFIKKEQPKEKQHQECIQRKYPFFSYNSPFYGYCFSCNDFFHMAIDCREHARNKIKINKIYRAIPQFLGHMRCFVCENIFHKAKDCKFPICLRRSNQNV